MLKKILNNWPLKLLSIVLAIIVWFIIISLADPTDIRTIYNVPVTLLNEDLLTQAGKSYYVEGGNNPTVNIRVSGRGSLIRELKASEFSASANIREMIDVNGAVPIQVNCSNPEISDSQISPSSNSLVIRYEDILSKDFTVSVGAEDEVPEGYFVGNTSASPRRVKVTAPASVLDRIGNVFAMVSVGEMTESSRVEARLEYYTNTGEQLQLSDYKDTKVSTDSVMVDVEIQTMKTVPMVISKEAVEEMKSQLSEGYRYTGHTELPMVQVKGLKSHLADLTAISIPPGTINIQDAEDDKTIEMDINFFLPEGIQLLDGQEPLFSVTLYVDSLVVREFSIRNIEVIGGQRGYRYDHDSLITVAIRGLEADFAGFDPSTIQATVDVGEYATTPGTYTLPLMISCDQEEIFTPVDGARMEVVVKAETAPTRERSTTAPPPTTEAETESKDPAETLPANP